MPVSYESAIAHLLSLGFELKAGKFFLDDIRVLARALDNPQDASPVVLIAGTNGKGSTAAMIAAALGEAGYRTGLYTSPHLVRVNERVRVNGADISDDDFAAAWQVVSAAIEGLLASGGIPKHPSFFECVTAIAWVHFRAQRCDVQVLEVGMGGRLDATNISRPVVSVITPVDLDHQAFLGDTLAEIAAEKAGIIRDHGVVVVAPQRAEAMDVILATAAERNARVIEVSAPVAGWELSLRGAHQRWNAAVALAALRALPGFTVTDEQARTAFAHTHWPGRLERVSTAPDVYLDGAHNPAGAHVLRAFMESTPRPRVLVFGAMHDKAIAEIAAILFPAVDAVVLTQPSHPRAATVAELRAIVEHVATRECEHAGDAPNVAHESASPQHALELAKRLATNGGAVFVAGSLFLVGDLK